MSEDRESEASVETLDLAATEGLPQLQAVNVSTRDLEPGRDRVRAVLAIGLTLLLAVVTICAVVAVWINPDLQSPIIEVLKVVFTPVVGLVGSAVGFYFGASAGSHATK